MPAVYLKTIATVASANKLPSFDLAIDHTAIYAATAGAEPGVIYLLTPRKDAPPITLPLDQHPVKEAAPLGALVVVTDTAGLPADVYILVLQPGGTLVNLIGASNNRERPAGIRVLPLPLARQPWASISSREMCLAWDTLQICLAQETPLRQDLASDLLQAIEKLNAKPEWFALDRAVPDVLGASGLDACREALAEKEPALAGCQATALAAAAKDVKSLPLPPGNLPPGAKIAGVGVLDVVTEIKDAIFLDPELTKPAPGSVLPPGAYLVYDIALPGDEILGKNGDLPVTLARAGLAPQAGKAMAFYGQTVRNPPLIGTPQTGVAPSNLPETVILGLNINIFDIVKGICFLETPNCAVQ